MILNPKLKGQAESWKETLLTRVDKLPKKKMVEGFVDSACDDGSFLVDDNDEVIDTIDDYYGIKIRLTIEVLE